MPGIIEFGSSKLTNEVQSQDKVLVRTLQLLCGVRGDERSETSRWEGGRRELGAGGYRREWG